MAEPKLQLEKRVEELEKQAKRYELAIGTMAQWLVQAQTGFNAKDAEGIEKILRGERDASEESSSEEMGVREQGEGVGDSAPLQQQRPTPEEGR